MACTERATTRLENKLLSIRLSVGGRGRSEGKLFSDHQCLFINIYFFYFLCFSKLLLSVSLNNPSQ